MKIIKTKIESDQEYELFDATGLKIGDLVIFNIYIKKENDFVIIIEAGTTITQKLYANLLKQEKLYIEKENKIAISSENLRFLIRQNRENPKKIVKILYEINESLFNNFYDSTTDKIDLETAKTIVKSALFLINYNDKFISAVMPFFTSGYKISNHCLHVMIYALKLGTLIDLSDEEILHLGLAALLHDIGYKNISHELLQKDTYLTPDELYEVNMHCSYGVEILKKNNITNQHIIDALKHHHERYDGSGYPDKLKKIHIGKFASILAICDVFDALTSKRPHRKELSTFDALRLMVKDNSMIGKFNQNYLSLAIKSL
ncbi:MAG: hypothetical protein QG559_752 [Campylobacterota bacterium]|nr:hypothetical protein [Campylobacterota bacterium]